VKASHVAGFVAHSFLLVTGSPSFVVKRVEYQADHPSTICDVEVYLPPLSL
jgi:hypothetical protein